MIILPTRQRLERRRDKLYTYLQSAIDTLSVSQVEQVMRQIHSINLRLKTYFNLKREPKEIFFNENDNDITTQDTSTGEIAPTTEELAQIEAEIQGNGQV